MSRMAIAKEVIDYIIERTRKGKDKEEKSFAPYSKSYQNSLDFKIAGKTSLVNLTLTKEMLDSLKLLNNKSGEITIGYDKNDKQLNGKVEGNRLGTYGNKKPVTKGRDFLGITQQKLKAIQDQFPTDNTDKDALLNKLAEVGLLDDELNKVGKVREIIGGEIIFDDSEG